MALTPEQIAALWEANLTKAKNAALSVTVWLADCDANPGQEMPNINDDINAANNLLSKLTDSLNDVSGVAATYKAEKKIAGLAEQIGPRLVDMGEDDVLITSMGSYSFPQ